MANTIGTVRVTSSNVARHAPPGENYVWRKGNQLRRVFAYVSGIGTGPASVDPQVATLGPAQFLQLLQERGEAGLVCASSRAGR